MLHQTQLELFDENLTADELVSKREGQWFDRKSFRSQGHGLADALIGFANADGGRIVVGIHNGEIEGIDHHQNSDKRLNELLQAARDHTVPPVRHHVHYVDCINRYGVPDRLLVLDIEASETIHRNRSQECFLRVGDENRKLGSTEQRELEFDKGEAIYDKTIARDVDIDDLDMVSIEGYAQRMHASDVRSLLHARGLVMSHVSNPSRNGVTQAGWLLFGKTPPIWSYIRFLRYSGNIVETGERSNLTEDIRLEGTIPELIQQAIQLLRDEIGTVIRLTSSGQFARIPALPEFAWLEAVVNAVTHRSYSLQGDGVRVTLFDDRLEVESPGRLPGLVRVQNIRNSRFSRNPHIARVLAEATGYVRELNEGVKRMFDEMNRSGLREPVFSSTGTTVKVILYRQPGVEINSVSTETVDLSLTQLRRLVGPDRLALLINAFQTQKQVPTREVASILHVAANTARRYLRTLEKAGLVTEVPRTSRDSAATWAATDHPFWGTSLLSVTQGPT